MKKFEDKLNKVKSPTAQVNESHREQLRQVAYSTLTQPRSRNYLRYWIPAVGVSTVAIALVVGIGVFNNVQNTDNTQNNGGPVAKLSPDLSPDEVKATATESLQQSIVERQQTIEAATQPYYRKVQVGVSDNAAATSERVVETWEVPETGEARQVVSTTAGDTLSTTVTLADGQQFVKYDVANYSKHYQAVNGGANVASLTTIEPGTDRLDELSKAMTVRDFQAQAQQVLDSLAAGQVTFEEEMSWHGYEVMVMKEANGGEETVWYFDIETAQLLGYEKRAQTNTGDQVTYELTLEEGNVETVDLSVDGFTATEAQSEAQEFSLNEAEIGLRALTPANWPVTMTEPSNSGYDYGADIGLVFGDDNQTSLQTYASNSTTGQEVSDDVCVQAGGESSEVTIGGDIAAVRCELADGRISYTFDIGPRTVELLTDDDSTDEFAELLASLQLL